MAGLNSDSAYLASAAVLTAGLSLPAWTLTALMWFGHSYCCTMYFYHREILRCLLFIYMVSAFSTAAQPALDPWRPVRPGSRSVRPPAGTGDLDPTSGAAAGSPAQLTAAAVTSQLTPPRPARGTRRGRRSRRRGRRGGARWRRPDAGLRSGELLIGEINVQSLKPHLPDLRLAVHQYDVVALCETWLSSNVPRRLLSIDGYQLFRCDRPVTSRLPRGRGGVAVLARQCLRVQVIDVPVTGRRLEPGNYRVRQPNPEKV